MNFSEIVTEVMSIVKRPDKLSEVRSAINSTVQYCSTKCDFARDLTEESKTIDPTLYAQSLALSNFLRFRKFRYIKPSNRNSYVNPLAPDKIFVRKTTVLGRTSDVEQLDKYYIAGDSLVFKLCNTAPSLITGYYQYPPVLANVDTFWTLEAMPFVIIEGSIAKAFRLLGDDASADRYQGQFLQSYAAASIDFKSGSAYG